MAKERTVARVSAPASAVSGEERLMLDVVEALRGADNLKERLLAALQSGTPAVADIAYAVKGRVKEDYKAIEKIMDRRRGSATRAANLNYSVSDVTDIVGLRIVTLYRLDALEVIEALLTAMNRDRSPSAPFVADSIGEIVIYTANPEGDVQKLPKRLVSLFQEHGLGGVTRIDGRSSNYSSIHLVARGRGKYGEGYREVPVEIQVRTALEDVWGQIEHGLKYKRKSVAAIDDAAGTAQRLNTTLDHLGALKTMVDGISQYADQIKLQLDELEPELRYSASRPAEDPSARLAAIKDLAPETRALFARVIGEARPGLIETSLAPARRTVILRSALSQLEELADAIPTIPDLSVKSRKELRYLVSMQRALAHFQLGNLIESGDRQLGRALALYREVERDFPGRLIVAYRLARTLDALGSREEAIEKMRAVVAQLADKGPIPDDHWVRAAAPRGLGVLLWESADLRSTRDGGASADSATLAILREAYELTAAAHAAEVVDDPLSGAVTSERARATNNLLFYLLDYLEAGGPPVPGLEEADVRRLLGEIAIGPIDQLPSLSFADTLRRAFAHLGEQEKERSAALRVIQLAAGNLAARSPVVRDAIRNAERTLERIGAASVAMTSATLAGVAAAGAPAAAPVVSIGGAPPPASSRRRRSKRAAAPPEGETR